MCILSGIPVFKGIAAAPVYTYQAIELKIEKERIDPQNINDELFRFKNIQKKVIQELKEHIEMAESSNLKEEIEIFRAHLMMAEDPILISKITDRIQKEHFSVEQAIEKSKLEIMDMFLQIKDAYLKTRAADVEDVANRLLELSLGISHKELSEIKENVILVAKDLKPSELSVLSYCIKGILLEEGSQTSHAAILAKAKGIPTIVGLSGIYNEVHSNDLIIVDSVHNKVYLQPTNKQLSYYKKQIDIINHKKLKANLIKEEAAITKDGKKIKLYGNISSSSEASLVEDNGGKGIGLLRTEFLYMNSSSFPTEEEQFNEYVKIVEKGFEDVIIRTLDIGGDKNLPYYKMKEEENPFLGFRAIRFTLANPDLFKIQLKAILRASAFGRTGIMFPMISCLDEVRKAKALLEECKNELRENKISFDADIRVGIMIETPAAAAIADILVEEVDFFSIGTNDLCQYTLAVDRMNNEVAYLYQPLHPGIIRLIHQTVNAAHNANKEVGICGEIAGEAVNALLLIGLNIDELSMSPAVIPEVKSLIRQISYKDAQQIAKRILLCKNTEDIKVILEQEIKKYVY